MTFSKDAKYGASRIMDAELIMAQATLDDMVDSPRRRHFLMIKNPSSTNVFLLGSLVVLVEGEEEKEKGLVSVLLGALSAV